ncbi:STM4011 family radical SAM protein [Paenibacillus sp. JX-17]|uniref:STM4011 family radical SAM protein n=1 Tax=Paenibacillus lacisoli TaxID=3064525 RepID=A0ABT9C712_9BACL|nr:STM4011 family radical SAM protein [Paenibacillus sp. JX-17]MDO7905059.1 STM4011 family radical SAM protein [Paenibacillus sp. JX-17]
MKAVIYYRGSLTSCNYDCPYCPFGKRRDSTATLAQDQKHLERFVEWVREQAAEKHQLSIFFNPYGEALIHRWYRHALAELSSMDHVEKIAIQTNLSARLDFVDQLKNHKVTFWASYHPGQVQPTSFLQQCQFLYERGVSFTVGSVGVHSAFAAITELRANLPKDVYVWVNAYKDKPDYYSDKDIEFLKSIDPLFGLNLMDYDSQGKSCMAGVNVFYVQASGRVKRCYKDRAVIGDLYRDGLVKLSQKRSCRMNTCDCYIGYIHLPELELENVYGSGLLERNPRL